MAYQCKEIGVQRRPTGMTVAYQLLDLSATPPRVVDLGGPGGASSFALEFVRADVVDPDTGQPFTAAKRIQLAKQQVQDHFQAIARRAEAGDADAAALSTALAGFTYP